MTAKHPTADESNESYSARLIRLQTSPWKRLVPVQLPYSLHLRSVVLPGSTLEIGCGIGRNLAFLGSGSVGVDIDPESVEYAVKRRQLTAFTPDGFVASAYGRMRFDTLLFSHVLEHLERGDAETLVSGYLKHLRPQGRLVLISPQERGQKSDPTHVRLFDFEAAASLAKGLGLQVERQYSFPFPRSLGRFFLYNEFVSLLRAP